MDFKRMMQQNQQHPSHNSHDNDDIEAEYVQDHVNMLDVIEPGSAIRKMQQLATQIYESTPGITQELPKLKSKILANVNIKEDDKGAKRARRFLAAGDGGRKIKQHGSIHNKDLAIEVVAEDWQNKYQEMQDKYQRQKNKTEDLQHLMQKKQEQYIVREREYRSTIKEMEETVKKVSQNPLELIPEHTQDETQLQKIEEQLQGGNKEVKLNVANQVPQGFSSQGDSSEVQPTQKRVKEIKGTFDSLQDGIGDLQKVIQEKLDVQKMVLYSKFDEEMDIYKKQLETANNKEKENEYDFKEQEKSLKIKLEAMTTMAQKIDDDNRKLMQKHSELKIQYLSQSDDRDLLLKQIIFHKKENQSLKTKHAEMKAKAEQIQADSQNESIVDQDQSSKSTQNRGSNQKTGSKVRKLNKNSTKKLNVQKSSANPIVNNSSQKELNKVNSRRNIGLTADSHYMQQFGRPKTAAMFTNHQGRPITVGARQQRTKTTTASNFYGPAGRAISANIVNNPRLMRFEDLISRLKRMLEVEKKNLRMVRTMCATEIETKNMLEKILRQCVDDVKSEIARKKNDNISGYYAKGRKGRGELLDEKNLTQQEREKIIEVLLSQERVLTLLYDKTFPPRPNSTAPTINMPKSFNHVSSF